MKIKIDISDLNLEILNLEIKEFILLRSNYNEINILFRKETHSYNVCTKYINLMLDDICKCEDEYRLKYPILYRKYKLKRILNENNNRKAY